MTKHGFKRHFIKRKAIKILSKKVAKFKVGAKLAKAVK